LCSAFNDELGNALSGINADRGVAKIHKQHQQFTTIIRINHASERIETVTRSQPGTRRNATIPAGLNLDGNASGHGFSFTGRKCERFETAKICAGGIGRTARWQLSFFVKFSDFDGKNCGCRHEKFFLWF
jgi:hypothetical protein